ncbi:MAG: hypothetical protein MK097_22650, partial [Dechloromonas sp.]|nr:hypothetical protein [Dechloromonas sp.]
KIPGLFGDQWQIFDNYLRFPFPESLFVNQNNHLLIFPSLIFLLDIHAFGGNQWFPQLCGMLLTVTFVSSLAYLSFTDRALPQLSRSAGFAACSLLIYWMATSRTLLHSNEIVCVFFGPGAVAVGRGGWAFMPGGRIQLWSRNCEFPDRHPDRRHAPHDTARHFRAERDVRFDPRRLSCLDGAGHQRAVAGRV